MTNPDTKSASRRGPIAAAVFYFYSLLLLPVSAIGYVAWIVALLARRTSRGSQTAQAPLTGRWLMHNLGSRRDEPANRLARVSAGVFLPLTLGPTLFAHRVSGYVPPSFRYPFEGEIKLSNQGAARQTYYDQVVARYLPEVAQFVILGAGFDTRTLRLPQGMPVRCFEIDTPATQATKRKLLAQVGIDARGVTFVPADFETEDWLKNLISAGFDPARPALFICEGVMPYLDRAAAEDTLRKIAGTAKGSVVAFDYFTSEVLDSSALSMRAIRTSLSAGGEPLKFGIDSTPPLAERVAELLQSCGLRLIEQRTLGPETQDRRAWGGFAVAGVK